MTARWPCVAVLTLVCACAAQPPRVDDWQHNARQDILRGDYAAAIAALSRLAQQGNRSEALFLLLDRALTGAVRPEARLANAEQGLYWYPDNWDLVFARLHALIDLERFDRARAELSALVLPDDAVQAKQLTLRALLAQIEISRRTGNESEEQHLMNLAERQVPGISAQLEAQRKRNARPAAHLPAANVDPWLSSHPTWERRIREIQARQAQQEKRNDAE